LLAARRTERLETLKQELVAQHPSINVSTFELDVRVKAKVNAAIEHFGDVDILVNNAGKQRCSKLAPNHVNRIDAPS
jgi:NADP-dependent 3-hydroxy acid dehydrogenase YdfG